MEVKVSSGAGLGLETWFQRTLSFIMFEIILILVVLLTVLLLFCNSHYIMFEVVYMDWVTCQWNTLPGSNDFVWQTWSWCTFGSTGWVGYPHDSELNSGSVLSHLESWLICDYPLLHSFDFSHLSPVSCNFSRVDWWVILSDTLVKFVQ